jgi:hypothetical protein
MNQLSAFIAIGAKAKFGGDEHAGKELTVNHDQRSAWERRHRSHVQSVTDPTGNLMTRTIAKPQRQAESTPLQSATRAIDAIDYDHAYRQRKRGIYVLSWSTVAFFVVAIAVSYAAALAHGYGTGFGDGKELTEHVRPWSGTGFWGDLGLLAGTAALDAAMLALWYFAASRLDNMTRDEPIGPDADDVDMNDAASWYVVNVPGLTKSLTVVALVCLLGIVIGAAVLLPVVTVRYGFVI